MTSVLTFVSSPGACPYLPDRESRIRYALDPGVTAAAYAIRLHEGWRRFGTVMFRNECAACSACQSLRIPVAAFTPSESQRRAWNKNVNGVVIRRGRPAASAEKLAIYERFQRFGHDTKGWSADDEPADLGFFINNPFPTEEWSFFVEERLVAVGYVDVLPESLSAIYFYWDPAERHRSLGTFNVLALIAAARQRGLPHVYLGYFVKGCRSLEYKARFRPSEVLIGGTWQPLPV
jgi:arginine-tRNA-protein transferase